MVEHPLTIAIAKNSDKLFKFLLENGVSTRINIRKYEIYTWIHMMLALNISNLSKSQTDKRVYYEQCAANMIKSLVLCGKDFSVNKVVDFSDISYVINNDIFRHRSREAQIYCSPMLMQIAAPRVRRGFQRNSAVKMDLVKFLVEKGAKVPGGFEGIGWIDQETKALLKKAMIDSDVTPAVDTNRKTVISPKRDKRNDYKGNQKYRQVYR